MDVRVANRITFPSTSGIAVHIHHLHPSLCVLMESRPKLHRSRSVPPGNAILLGFDRLQYPGTIPRATGLIFNRAPGLTTFLEIQTQILVPVL